MGSLFLRTRSISGPEIDTPFDAVVDGTKIVLSKLDPEVSLQACTCENVATLLRGETNKFNFEVRQMDFDDSAYRRTGFVV